MKLPKLIFYTGSLLIITGFIIYFLNNVFGAALTDLGFIILIVLGYYNKKIKNIEF